MAAAFKAVCQPASSCPQCCRVASISNISNAGPDEVCSGVAVSTSTDGPSGPVMPLPSAYSGGVSSAGGLVHLPHLVGRPAGLAAAAEPVSATIAGTHAAPTALAASDMQHEHMMMTQSAAVPDSLPAVRQSPSQRHQLRPQMGVAYMMDPDGPGQLHDNHLPLPVPLLSSHVSIWKEGVQGEGAGGCSRRLPRTGVHKPATQRQEAVWTHPSMRAGGSSTSSWQALAVQQEQTGRQTEARFTTAGAAQQQQGQGAASHKVQQGGLTRFQQEGGDTAEPVGGAASSAGAAAACLQVQKRGQPAGA